MFATRTRLAIATVALAVATPIVAVSGTASAEESAAAPQTVEVAKKKRTIYLKGKEAREGVFIAFGRTTPDYEKRQVIVQRKLKSAKSWDNSKKIKTNSKSKYRTRIAALKRPGIVCYRIKINGNSAFKTSYSTKIVNGAGQQVSFPKVCIRTSRG